MKLPPRLLAWAARVLLNEQSKPQLSISEAAMSRLELAIRQIKFTRGYTNDMLQHIHVNDWFHMPKEGVTHIAWQVGHLAMAEYRLLLERVRGVRDEDEQLLPKVFLEKFGKGSVPTKSPDDYPSSADIVGVFDRVHQQALKELPNLPDEVLDEPPETPHQLLKTKYDSLIWMAHHEMLHAGQIGLLRRLLGEKPLR